MTQWGLVLDAVEDCDPFAGKYPAVRHETRDLGEAKAGSLHMFF